MNIYEARFRNAQRLGRRIQSLIDQGYIVRDGYDSIVSQMEVTDFAVYQLTGDGKCRIIWFENDLEYDHGLYTKIEDFNAHFAAWTYTRPNAARPIIRMKRNIDVNRN